MRRVSISTADQTAGYLASKVVTTTPGTVTLSIADPGLDEKLQIDVVAGSYPPILPVDISALCSLAGVKDNIYTIKAIRLWDDVPRRRVYLSYMVGGQGNTSPDFKLVLTGAAPVCSPDYIGSLYFAMQCGVGDPIVMQAAPGLALIPSGSDIITFSKDWTGDQNWSTVEDEIRRAQGLIEYFY